MSPERREDDELVPASPESASADASEPAGAMGREDANEPAEAIEPTEAEAERTLEARVEALLFSSEVPLPAARLAGLLRAEKRDVLEAVDRLNMFYGETRRAFRITAIAGGFQMVTTTEHADVLVQLQKDRVPSRLSQAALETLAIIAFKQPVTRAEIDAIRGVTASDRVLRHLIDRKVVRIAGRSEAVGRPLLYGTTREFLAYFGLEKLTDLPRPDELAALLAGEFPAEAAPGGILAEFDAELHGELSADEVDEADEADAAAAPQESVRDPHDESDLFETDDSADEESSFEPSVSHSGEESDDRDGASSA